MQKRNRSFIFSAYFFSSLGYSFIGIFYPILLKNAFGLSFEMALLLIAGYWGLYTIMLYPLHWWVQKHFSLSARMAIGQMFLALFYFFLKNPLHEWWYLLMTGLSFAISVAFYWGNLEFVMQKNTDHKKRGEFWGLIQSITIGVNIITPAISSYFLESFHASWVFWIGIIVYMGSAGMFFLLKDTDIPKLKSITPKINFQKAVISEFFQHGITGSVYPLLIVVTLGSLKIFGIFLGIMSAIELVASLFFGHITDKISAKKMLHYGVTARMIDMIMRIGLVFFPTFWMGGLISIIAPIFGPLYQPAYMSRISRVIEKSEDSFSYWIYRGFLSGIARIVFLPFVALCAWKWGIYGTIPAFLIAGISTLWVRKL